MRARSRPSERGVALILVLVVLPLVAIIMTQLNFETTIGTRLSSNALAAQQFKLAIRARLEQIRLRLARDLNDDNQGNTEGGGARDFYGDLWGPDTEGGMTNLQVTRGDPDAGDDVTLYTQVTDEQGKFNLNLLLHTDPQRAARAMTTFKNLLNFFRDERFDDLQPNEYDLDESQVKEVAEAVLRFLKGEGRDERVQKSEKIPDPGPDLKQGLFTVDDLVFSHKLFVEKKLLTRFKDVGSGQVLPGLDEFLTIYGDGKINANTAPVQVLRAMFTNEEDQKFVAEGLFHGRGGYLNTDEDQDAKREALEERRLDDGTTSNLDEEQPADDTGYMNVNDLQRIEGFDAQAMRQNEIDLGRDFTVRSNWYLVIITARRENFLRQHRCVFERHAKGCLTWSSEVRTADIDDLPEDLDLIREDSNPELDG